MKNWTLKRQTSSEAKTIYDDDLPNFWVPGAFSQALKRLENTLDVTGDLQTMLDELTDFEARAAKFYVDFAAKWKKHFTNGRKVYEGRVVLYGTSKETVKKAVDLMDEFGKVHLDNWTQIQSKCLMPLKNFNEKHIENNSLMKTLKAIRDDFQTAQTPYVELFSNFKKARSQYMTLCVSLKPDFTLESSVEVFKDVDPKKNEKRLTLQKRFEEWNKQLEIMIPHYQNKMKEAFSRCDEIEEKKLEVMIKAITGLGEVLSGKFNERHGEFVKNFEAMLAGFDSKRDLVTWAKNLGPDMDYDFFQKVCFSLHRMTSRSISAQLRLLMIVLPK